MCIHMNLLQQRLCEVRSLGRKSVIPFVTAGDPSLDSLPAILDMLAEAGATAIEVGIPFSDPIADGPTIQASSQRALERGVRPSDVLTALASWQNPGVPLILMGYYNPILRMGLDSFAIRAKEAGAHAVIVCDLTPEEAGPWSAAAQSAGLDTIFLVAPTSTEARLDDVARASTGFVYAVSRTGVTGAASQGGSPEIEGLIQKVRDRTEVPVLVGFGISSPEHVTAMCSISDGVIVGSSLVQRLASDWNGGAGRAEILAYVKSLVEANGTESTADTVL